jgi:hypothetical protein
MIRPPFSSFVSKPYPCLFSLPYSVTEDERRYRLHSVRSSVPRSRPIVLDDFLFAFLVLTRTSRFGSGSPRDERQASGRNNRSSKQIQLYCTCPHMHHITPDVSPASHAVWNERRLFVRMRATLVAHTLTKDGVWQRIRYEFVQGKQNKTRDST